MHNTEMCAYERDPFGKTEAFILDKWEKDIKKKLAGAEEKPSILITSNRSSLHIRPMDFYHCKCWRIPATVWIKS